MLKEEISQAINMHSEGASPSQRLHAHFLCPPSQERCAKETLQRCQRESLHPSLRITPPQPGPPVWYSDHCECLRLSEQKGRGGGCHHLVFENL